MVMLLNRQTMSGVCEFRVAGCGFRVAGFEVGVAGCGVRIGIA